MDYSDIDPVIQRWVLRLDSKLFTEWNGEPARFFYTPGDPPFECFQICVDRRLPYEVAVYARAVDTNDDSEGGLKQSWQGSPTDLDGMLANAVECVEKWKGRPRVAPDPASPW